MSSSSFPVFSICRGFAIEAEYQDPILEDYRGNPLIEALPPVWDEATVVQKLVSKPRFQPYERELPTHLKLHCVQRIGRDLFQPMSRHLELEQNLSRLIRDGYVGRNPLTPNYAFRARRDTFELITKGITEGYPVNNPTSSGFALVGISGIGKSSSIMRILSLYPQVILHSKYQESNLSLYQIVWIKMDCPHDGSIRGLCLNFFLAVDSLVGTQYYKKHASGRKTVDELLPIMAQVAAVHCIGVLVIDEIQNLIEAKVGAASKMLNFFVQMVNTIGLPVVLVGTFKAMPILNGEFRNARRATGQGDMIWDRLKNNEEWIWLLQGLWKYQWTQDKAELTQEIIDIMYEESQGITDIVIKLFMLSQWRAIDKELSCVTPQLITSIAKDRLQLLQPALKALKSGDPRKISAFGDVYSSVNIDDELKQIEHKYKQEERLEMIRQELGFNPLDETRKVIEKWLVDAGFANELAEKAAAKVVVDFGNQLEEIDYNQEALKVVLEMLKHETKEPSRTQNDKKKRKKSVPVDIDDLRFIVEQGKKLNLSPYEALKKAQYIKDPKEFLN